MPEQREMVYGNAADFRRRFGAGYWPLAETTFPNSPLSHGAVEVTELGPRGWLITWTSNEISVEELPRG